MDNNEKEWLKVEEDDEELQPHLFKACFVAILLEGIMLMSIWGLFKILMAVFLNA